MRTVCKIWINSCFIQNQLLMFSINLLSCPSAYFLIFPFLMLKSLHLAYFLIFFSWYKQKSSQLAAAREEGTGPWLPNQVWYPYPLLQGAVLHGEHQSTQGQYYYWTILPTGQRISIQGECCSNFQIGRLDILMNNSMASWGGCEYHVRRENLFCGRYHSLNRWSYKYSTCSRNKQLQGCWFPTWTKILTSILDLTLYSILNLI